MTGFRSLRLVTRSAARGGREGRSGTPLTHLRWSRSRSASCWCCSTSSRSCRTASLSCEFSQRRPPSLGEHSAAPFGEPAGPGLRPSCEECSQERCFQEARRAPGVHRPAWRPSSSREPLKAVCRCTSEEYLKQGSGLGHRGQGCEVTVLPS